MAKQEKVFCAMSGGVDSSVAALLLKKSGYDVTGVYMKGWSFTPHLSLSVGLTDCAEEDATYARRAANAIGIPFYVFNFENEFKKEVVDYMVSEYAAGRTPNPDVMCNRKIKFGLFLEKALALGADYIATGHYVEKSQISNLKSQNYILKIAKDKNKDQSYFLWTLTQKQLKHCFFPIGDYTKPQVRAIAKKYNLPTAERPDSQGVCFVGEIDVAEFLKNKLGKNPGPIKTLNGKIIGGHDGAAFYTIGQRRGIGIKGSLPGEQGKIYYVAAKDLKTNTIFVAEGKDENLFRNKLSVKNINWISGNTPKLPLKCLARIRYRQPLQQVLIINRRMHELPIGCRCIHDSQLIVQFKEAQRAVTPGQSAVFYKMNGPASTKASAGMETLGGGIIDS